MDDSLLDQVYVTKRISSDHNDLLHDVSFDFFGKRMATCSSDQNVKVGLSLFLPVVQSRFYYVVCRCIPVLFSVT